MSTTPITNSDESSKAGLLAKVRKAMVESGRSRLTMAKEAGVAYGTIQAIYRGETNLRDDSLVKVARALGIDAEYRIEPTSSPSMVRDAVQTSSTPKPQPQAETLVDLVARIAAHTGIDRDHLMAVIADEMKKAVRPEIVARATKAGAA